MKASDKPRMVEILPGDEYDYFIEHREDIGTPLFYITDNRMYVMSDSLATWRAGQLGDGGSHNQSEGGK